MSPDQLNAKVNGLLMRTFADKPEDLATLRLFCRRYAAMERAWKGGSKILDDAALPHRWVLTPGGLEMHQDEMDDWSEAWVQMRNLDAEIERSGDEQGD